MKIAITGARGSVGRTLVKLCSEAGHHTVQINRTHTEHDGTPNSEMRTADVAKDYEGALEAFRGCDALIHLAAIPDPVGKPNWHVHSNNVNSAFNGFHAAGELVNAIGLVFSNKPLHFDYFPIDEDTPQRPTDAYALAKAEAEYQAKCFVDWFPQLSIVCLRIHEVAPLKEARKRHKEKWHDSGVRQLWGWVNPRAVARACLLAVESDNITGFEIINIISPTTTQETPSEELAKRYFPNAQIRGDMSKNQGFWTTDKAARLLGWMHDETE
ncbi:UDP-galactose 4-epimerase, putative [Talaromyces stipitatus ATCC 10500]|uniref:UDP-galactose 4-epimerase, putative n=1 Tax=Talaromyces stipitatus (strain ATCC 10500 / CBS 375.48 / QM 6759 / NRRL 1006) TaxID=441959 RepID=B8MHF3_TALSN|nr:UDP-galactose 4-epimerase, putative [Talaromyces stipitatus ATCC 10500]EED17132.1 UDP-galactose 4-epimerase, putative [Talaromyces stipitatus ATCC 10500]